MDLRQRNRMRNEVDRRNPPDPGASRAVSASREEADRLLAAADQAIRKALSRNSRDFLWASRQEGGQ